MERKVVKMKTKAVAVAFLLVSALVLGCVSNKKYMELENNQQKLSDELTGWEQKYDLQRSEYNQLELKQKETENKFSIKEIELAGAQLQARQAQAELEYLKNSNTLLLDRLADLSVVSKTGVESIKKSLEALEERNEYIRQLSSSLRRADSVNLMLVMNLKRSLENFDDEDVNIVVKKGVVYISLSDKLLFRSGSSEVTPRAHEVLGKIALIVNDHNQLDLLIEGHTDNVAIGKNLVGIQDNWDLSSQRAISIVRILQDEFKVDPARLTAAGRSKYIPKASNETAEGRSLNRRTEIVILPKLDEFFKLLEPQMMEKVGLNR